MKPQDTSRSDSAGSVRLLICDDSQTERTALAQFFRQAGYAVDEAGDGEAAMLHLRNRAVDLLLLDLHLPDLDGFDILKFLQKNLPELPVVLMSGMALDDIQHSMQRLPERQLPPLMLKPLDPQQLLDVVTLKLQGELPA
jgi:DNA-binding response OmpR family regulator